MINTVGIGRLGLLAVGLGIGAAVAAMPPTASADTSTDPFSWIGGLDLGDLSVPAPAATLDMQISIDGMDLLPTAGNTATASSGMGDIAIAIGPLSFANANDGLFDSAFADGSGSNAVAGLTGNFDSATAIGSGSNAVASVGSLDSATADGTGSTAFAVEGSADSATANGDGSTAMAENGSNDTASVFGTNSLAQALFGNGDVASINNTGSSPDFAVAGGLSATNLGSNDMASVVGTGSSTLAGSNLGGPGDFDIASVLANDSSAQAGSSLTAAGNFDFAAVFADMLHAMAIGSSNLVDILP